MGTKGGVNTMKHISFDPSGNWGKEGMGTTGVCLLDNGNRRLYEIKATDYDSEESYWNAHKAFIEIVEPDFVTMEGYRLYNHKGSAAQMQSNSEMQTSQIIGFLKMVCWLRMIPYNIQFASEIKTRWSEDVLVRLGILEKKGRSYYFNGELTSTHKRDSLKHSLHWEKYKQGEK